MLIALIIGLTGALLILVVHRVWRLSGDLRTVRTQRDELSRELATLREQLAVRADRTDKGESAHQPLRLIAQFSAAFSSRPLDEKTRRIAEEVLHALRDSIEMRSQLDKLNQQLSVALGEAETANRAKTRFLASASHDLRQPVHTLSLFCAALSMRQLDERTRQIVDHINVALETLASQLDALLDISKLDAGVVEKRIAIFDLEPMLQRLENEFRALCEAKGLRMERSGPGGPLLIETDAALLERVLRNLLSNAVKYTDSGFVQLATRAESGRIVLQIADSGNGIPKNEHERVFEEFYQLDNPERDHSKGLGLGLAIVKRLLAMLEIAFTMHSESGHGTIFDLKLSGSHVMPAATRQIPVPPPTQSQTLRILVIDDEAAVRAGMEALLGALGYEVTLADSTEDAIGKARASHPQLVLADLRLRGDDNGIRAVHAVRSIVPGVPALLISGDTAPERLRDANRAAIRLLHKPVGLDELRDSIREVCGMA